MALINGYTGRPLVFRSLHPDDKLRPWDAVEDIASGKLEWACDSPYYRSLIGEKVSQIRQLPQVFDVVTPLFERT